MSAPDGQQAGRRESAWLAEGFAPWPARGAFIPANARLFHRADPDQLRFRIELEARHCNGTGRVHGGFIATLADVWLASNLARRLPPEACFVTASLNVDFLQAVRAGEWLESRIDWVRPGARLGHVEGRIYTEGTPVAAMRGIFAIL